MKTIIYLPLMLLIVLYSCKSNSFTKQRYTNFTHHSNKNTITKKHLAQPEQVVVEPVETETVEYPQSARAAEAGPLLFVKENLIKPLKNKIQPADLKITNTDNKEAENSKAEFKNKTIKKQSSMAQRIVGTLLKIVLWVIILAVVVGVFLIVAALA